MHASKVESSFGRDVTSATWAGIASLSIYVCNFIHEQYQVSSSQSIDWGSRVGMYIGENIVAVYAIRRIHDMPLHVNFTLVVRLLPITVNSHRDIQREDCRDLPCHLAA